ncbi:MAG: selenite/tellurite reduction operon b-type cytochrome membrane protein ExtQ [Desulfuromonadales bacterium]
MKNYLRSSPHFFRPVKRAFVLAVATLLLLAFFVPAPLQGPADPGRVPNPVKSAWFLLWTQEVVSYSTLLIYPGMVLFLLFLLLPWLPGTRQSERARWLPPEQWPASLLTVGAFAAILLLTLIAAFFRGENWSFVLPF